MPNPTGSRCFCFRGQLQLPVIAFRENGLISMVSGMAITIAFVGTLEVASQWITVRRHIMTLVRTLWVYQIFQCRKVVLPLAFLDFRESAIGFQWCLIQAVFKSQNMAIPLIHGSEKWSSDHCLYFGGISRLWPWRNFWNCHWWNVLGTGPVEWISVCHLGLTLVPEIGENCHLYIYIFPGIGPTYLSFLSLLI